MDFWNTVIPSYMAHDSGNVCSGSGDGGALVLSSVNGVVACVRTAVAMAMRSPPLLLCVVVVAGLIGLP